MFRRYLLDASEDLWGAIKADWVGGNLDLSKEDDVRGYMRAHLDIADLRFEQIARFYVDQDAIKEKENEANAAQGSED